MECFNVKTYGAKGDGVSLDTAAIQRTIDAASSVGGTVYFPMGEYVTGTLKLKSNITLQVSAKAVILGSGDISDYRSDIIGCIEAPSFDRCLIYAEKAENIRICGQGLIWGRGEQFPAVGGVGEVMRPMLFRFVECSHVQFADIRLKDSASWCCHMMRCENVSIHNVTLSNHGNRNNDGFDLDNCSGVTISDTRISSIDDAICLKSTNGFPNRNIAVTNCVLSSETAAIKFGTASKAGFKNIAVSNCVFHDCPMGTIKLMCVDGGVLENVTFDNIVMDNVGSPLFIRVGKRNLTFEKPAENDFWGKGQENDRGVGVIRNILLSNIRASVTVSERDKTPMMIAGLEDSRIKNVTLRNLDITFPGGGTREDAERIVDEDPYRYPEQWFFGVLPAWGLFARHVEDLRLQDVRIRTSEPDERPPVILEDAVEGNDGTIAL